MALKLLLSCVALMLVFAKAQHNVCARPCTMLFTTSSVDGGPQSLAPLFWGWRLNSLGTPCLGYILLYTSTTVFCR